MPHASHSSAPRGRASRRGVALAFASLGVGYGAWLGVLPSVRTATHATTGQLGLAMLVGALGAAPGMWLGGRVGDRFPARGTAVALALTAGCGALPVFARSPLQLGLALLAWGVAATMLNIAMNADAGGIERHTGATVMQRVHAVFSSGLLVGSALTAALFALHAPYATPVLLSSGLALVAAWNNRRALPTTTAATRAVEPAMAAVAAAAMVDDLPGDDDRREVLPAGLGYLVLLGVAAALGRVVESDVQGWSTIHLRDTLHAAPALAAAGPSAFAVSMVAMRLGADRTFAGVDRHRVLVGSGLVSAVSTSIFAWAPTPWVALLALVVSGVSLSVVVPVLFSLSAAAARGVGAGRAIARMSAVSWIASLGAPPAIGALADAWGLRVALTLAATTGIGLALCGVVAMRLTATARATGARRDDAVEADGHAAVAPVAG